MFNRFDVIWLLVVGSDSYVITLRLGAGLGVHAWCEDRRCRGGRPAGPGPRSLMLLPYMIPVVTGALAWRWIARSPLGHPQPVAGFRGIDSDPR
jgi:ABC-type sugar transport system permease subunit